MGRRLASTAVLFSIVGSLMIASSGAALASPSGDFVSKTNAERTSRGLNALKVSSHLYEVALEQSKRMAARGSIYHNPSLGSDVNGWTVVGENVGVGSTVQKIHNAFMASPGHRANILDRAYSHVGIAVVIKDGRIWVTEVFAKFASARRTASRSTSGTDDSRSLQTRSASREQVAPRPVIRERARNVDLLERMLTVD